MKDIKIEKGEIIDLVLCADYYGFDHDILYAFLFDKLGDITEEEVREYITKTYDPQTEEEAEDCEIKSQIVLGLKYKFENLEEINLEN